MADHVRICHGIGIVSLSRRLAQLEARRAASTPSPEVDQRLIRLIDDCERTGVDWRTPADETLGPGASDRLEADLVGPWSR